MFGLFDLPTTARRISYVHIPHKNGNMWYMKMYIYYFDLNHQKEKTIYRQKKRKKREKKGKKEKSNHRTTQNSMSSEIIGAGLGLSVGRRPDPYTISISFAFCFSLTSLRYPYVPSSPLI